MVYYHVFSVMGTSPFKGEKVSIKIIISELPVPVVAWNSARNTINKTGFAIINHLKQP